MKKITAIVSLIILCVIAIYDVFAILKGGTEASISHMIITASYKFPALPFISGFVMGHLFWRMGDTKDTNKIAENNKE